MRKEYFVYTTFKLEISLLMPVFQNDFSEQQTGTEAIIL